MSYTSLKRRFTQGSTVRVTNHRLPDLSGTRTVVKQQTNGIYTGPATRADGKVLDKVWAAWPTADQVRVLEPETPGEGVPKIEFLNKDTGEVAFSYELLEGETP